MDDLSNYNKLREDAQKFYNSIGSVFSPLLIRKFILLPKDLIMSFLKALILKEKDLLKFCDLSCYLWRLS